MDSVILYKSREVKHCPPHFIKVPVHLKSTTSPLNVNSSMHQLVEGSSTARVAIRNWLHESIKNRFFIGETFNNVDGFLIESFSVAFEDPADATYFTLLLPSFLE